MAVRDERGIVLRRRQPPRWFRLSYLVTAWTKQPQDEHRLLSAVLATLLPHELLAPHELPGALGALGLSVPLSVANLHTESRSLAEIWSALAGELKPSLDLVVTVPFPSFPEYDAGPPVLEAGVRVQGIDGTLEGSPERRHQAGTWLRRPRPTAPGHPGHPGHGSPGRGRHARRGPPGSGRSRRREASQVTLHVPASAHSDTSSGATDTSPASPASPATAPEAPADALLRRLSRLRDRVALLVEHRSAADPTAADPLRGLYLTEDAVRRLLAPAGPDPESTHQDWTREPGDRLSLLAGRLGLTELDVRILLIALAPDLDRTFEPLYGYLNDDVSRRRAGTGLALDLCGLPAHHAEARARFRPSAPLAALGLVVVEETERPFLSRSLRVPDRLIAHLLGDETLDSALGGHVRRLRAAARGEQYDEVFLRRLADRLAGAPFTAYLREHRAGDGLACAAAALRGSGREALHFTPGATDAREPIAELLREARLRDCVIVVSPLPKDPAPLMRALAVGDVSVLFVDPQPYDPHWCDHRDPLVLDAPGCARARWRRGRRRSARGRSGRRVRGSVRYRRGARTGNRPRRHAPAGARLRGSTPVRGRLRAGAPGRAGSRGS